MSDLLALRLGALRLARRRGNVVDGAWAAARLRLKGVQLDPADARFGREMQRTFGHRLRIARMRAARRPGDELVDELPAPQKLSRSRRWFVVLAVTLVVVLLIVMYPQYGELIEPGGGTPIAASVPAPTASPLRGRTEQLVVLVVQPVETPAPTESATPAPTASATATPAPRSGSTGTGGSGGGSGGGTGTGTGSGSGPGIASPTPTPTPTPSPTPAPTIDEANAMHLRGRVVNARTGVGVPGVCVAIGVTNCARSPMSDDNGYWAVDLTIGQVLAWDIKFIRAGYVTAAIRVPSQPGTHTIPDIRLRPLP